MNKEGTASGSHHNVLKCKMGRREMSFYYNNDTGRNQMS